MNRLLLFSIYSVLILCSACKSDKQQEAQIVWDTWGVPHIYADNVDALFYQQGWAQMHSHAKTILKLYGTSRERLPNIGGKEIFKTMLWCIHLVLMP